MYFLFDDEEDGGVEEEDGQVDKVEELDDNLDGIANFDVVGFGVLTWDNFYHCYVWK